MSVVSVCPVRVGCVCGECASSEGWVVYGVRVECVCPVRAGCVCPVRVGSVCSARVYGEGWVCVQ